MHKTHKFLVFVLCLLLMAVARPIDISEIGPLIKTFKSDPRGPYQAIRWFCPDGTTLPPQERCPQPGGIQHALPKDVITQIAKEHGIFLGQILAGTSFVDFLDQASQNSRLKQYEIEKYLQAVDDGWIMRKARYYRGAIQAEDEEAWGQAFLKWLLAQDDLIREQFFLVRQIGKDVPHAANEDRGSLIRGLATTIADSLPSFMDIRVKIHAKPDQSDIERVTAFRNRNKGKIPADVDQKLERLQNELALYYQEATIQQLDRYLDVFPITEPVGFQLRKTIRSQAQESAQMGLKKDASDNADAENLIATSRNLAHLLWVIRRNMIATNGPHKRLSLIELSNKTEAVLANTMSRWQARTIGDLFERNYILAKASAGCGFIEIWEWEYLEPLLYPSDVQEPVSLTAFLEKVDHSRRAVEWGSAMVRAVYDPVVNLFSQFEPLTNGFIDDRIRASLLLPWGDTTGKLADLASRLSGLSNRVLNIRSQNDVRGLNPGIAVGQLEVINGPPEDVPFSPDKIYMLLRAPADIKPVAGIATVSEGNTVSHVQLLARNLGIPNSVISLQNLTDLAAWSGTTVFYAVSPRGTVLLKPTSEMTSEEKALVANLKKTRQRIAVPTDKLNLKQANLISLAALRATDSGKIAGPKAANLGQLKSYFPDKVPAGLVIPFGVFRNHLDQPMPGRNVTCWSFLQSIFSDARRQHDLRKGDYEIELEILKKLQTLREAIQTIPFLPGFREQLGQQFRKTFGVPMGQLPVFIRSDTNMEDLKEFTGAGLNLTVANIKDEEQMFQAIRKVWASPFTERSYGWRQKYLENPENVYPSILLLPSVNVDKSGVLITTGVSTSNPKDLTVAFNWGVGGAVAGQAAESYLLRNDGEDVLLSPAREPQYNSLPLEGGVKMQFRYFSKPILNPSERFHLRIFAKEIAAKLPGTPGMGSSGPYDVELGFWDNAIWLFQVRPFVENKMAKSSAYLNAMDSGSLPQIRIPLNKTFAGSF